MLKEAFQGTFMHERFDALRSLLLVATVLA